VVKVYYDKKFKKILSKINKTYKIKIVKQIKKIIKFPEIGKPMQYERKGTRELYVKPYRLAYSWDKDELIIVFLDIYHKNNQ
jgi:mRNA-degrading endonuclease RelE of RelBE toxin-antitoxin system